MLRCKVTSQVRAERRNGSPMIHWWLSPSRVRKHGTQAILFRFTHTQRNAQRPWLTGFFRCLLLRKRRSPPAARSAEGEDQSDAAVAGAPRIRSHGRQRRASSSSVLSRWVVCLRVTVVTQGMTYPTECTAADSTLGSRQWAVCPRVTVVTQGITHPTELTTATSTLGITSMVLKKKRRKRHIRCP